MEETLVNLSLEAARMAEADIIRLNPLLSSKFVRQQLTRSAKLAVIDKLYEYAKFYEQDLINHYKKPLS